METQAIPRVITREDAVQIIMSLWKEKNRPILVGVSGLGASGKSTLAEWLHKEITGSSLLEVDDFYKTAAERAGENVSTDVISNKFDWEYLDQKVFTAIKRKQDIHYQRCRREIGVYDQWQFHSADKVVFVEGIYAFQDRFVEKYDYRIWVETPYDVRLRRGVARDELTRDGEASRIAWETIWLPQDQRYFNHDRPDLRADAIINGI